MDKLIKFDLQVIRGTAPNVVILDIGLNYLCNKQADPDMVALSILALVEVLLTPKARTTATDVENYVTSVLLLFSV